MTIGYKIDINQYIIFILLLGGYTIKFKFFKHWRKKKKKKIQHTIFKHELPFFFFFSNNNNNNNNKKIIEEIWCVAEMAESGP